MITARVVEDEQVARIEQLRQFGKDMIDARQAAPIEQTRCTALGCRMLRDQFGRQVEVEVVGLEVAGRAGHQYRSAKLLDAMASLSPPGSAVQRLAVSVRRDASTGLVRKSFMPASRHASLSSAKALAVSAMIGTT